MKDTQQALLVALARTSLHGMPAAIACSEKTTAVSHERNFCFESCSCQKIYGTEYLLVIVGSVVWFDIMLCWKQKAQRVHIGFEI